MKPTPEQIDEARQRIQNRIQEMRAESDRLRREYAEEQERRKFNWKKPWTWLQPIVDNIAVP